MAIFLDLADSGSKTFCIESPNRATPRKRLVRVLELLQLCLIEVEAIHRENRANL